MSEKLKPCPWCGGEAYYVTAYGVKCTGCTAKLPATHAEHIKLWNARALEQELVEALTEIVNAPRLPYWAPEFQHLIDVAKTALTKAEGKFPNNQTDGVA